MGCRDGFGPSDAEYDARDKERKAARRKILKEVEAWLLDDHGDDQLVIRRRRTRDHTGHTTGDQEFDVYLSPSATVKLRSSRP